MVLVVLAAVTQEHVVAAVLVLLRGNQDFGLDWRLGRWEETPGVQDVVAVRRRLVIDQQVQPGDSLEPEEVAADLAQEVGVGERQRGVPLDMLQPCVAEYYGMVYLF